MKDELLAWLEENAPEMIVELYNNRNENWYEQANSLRQQLEKRTIAHAELCVEHEELKAQLAEKEREIEDYHKDGHTIYAMMNDKRVDELKAQLDRCVEAIKFECDRCDNAPVERIEQAANHMTHKLMLLISSLPESAKQEDNDA